MNKASKLNRKSSENNSTSSSSYPHKNKKKKPNARVPLKDLYPSYINQRVSNENETAPKRGCFSFLDSNSNSSRSAPANSTTLPLKNDRKQSNSSLEKTKLKNSNNRLVPISKQLILGDGCSSKGKIPNPAFNFDVHVNRNECLNDTEVVKCGKIATTAKLDKTRKEPWSSSFGNSKTKKSKNQITPVSKDEAVECEKTVTPEKCSGQNNKTDDSLSKTPKSNTTPPIYSSVSPEIGHGSSMDLRPGCFAAGHVVTGVKDRRKCRPRGVLKVGEGKEASIQWLSPPNFDSTPTMEETSIQETLYSNSGLSPFSTILQREIDRSPTLNSNISPFTAMLQGYAAKKSMKEGILSPLKLNSMAEVFESLKLSPRKDLSEFLPPMPELSFQFNCTGMNPNSNSKFFDLSFGSENSKSMNADSSSMRISWRDELDCDDQDNVNCLKEELDGSKNMDLEIGEEDDENVVNISGSFEFPVRDIGVKRHEENFLTRFELCRESFCTDAGLISSEESDWTPFYKK